MNETCGKLDMAMLDLFHCILVRFLYVAKRARPDLQVTVAFLCKRVKFPNIGDWKKFGRLAQYVRAIIHIPLIIEPDGSGNMVWSIDTSFVIHMDMKSHIGYCLTLGKESPISGLSAKK